MSIKKTKIVFLILTFILAVFLMDTATYADIDENAHSGGTTTGDKLLGGPASMKTGVYVTVSVADKDGGLSHAIGHGALLKTKGGQNIPKFDVASESKINGSSCAGGTEAPWPYPAFRAGSSAQGFGQTIVNWAKQPDAKGSPRAYLIANKYCGVSTEDIAKLLAQNKVVYLNFEPCMFCNSYGNSAKSKGPIIVGLVKGIGNAVPEGKTYISSVTKSGFPKSFMYENYKNWQGIKGVNPPSGLVSNADMTNTTIGYGICSLKFNQGLQVIIVCENDTGGYDTEYLSTDKTWGIENPYKGCKFVEATFSTKKSTVTDPHASYSTICGSGKPNRSVGTGTQTFDISNGEQALFIHYKGTPIEPIQTETDLKAWEVGYVMPKYAASRTDGASVNNSYTLAKHIQEIIDMVKGFTQSCPENGSHCGHVQAMGHAVIDRVTCRGNTDWQNTKYNISANLGAYPNAIWNLYRSDISGVKWDTFNNALGDKSRWTINKEVDPQFSYYLTRSHLENASVSPDREGLGATATLYNKAPNYNWEIKYKGKEGKEQKANTTGTHEVDNYNYSFTAYGYLLQIDYHFEHDEMNYSKSEERDDGLGNKTTVVTHECSHSAHSFGYNSYTENAYTPNEWIGSTGGHKEDKFKTKVMPSGKNTNAGQVVETIPGDTLSGKFAKTHDSFNYKAVKAQLVGSEFQGVTYSIYPEVAMSLWVSGNTEKYINTTERLVYVMGEYERHYTPPIAHSYKTSIDDGNMKGIGSLASAATGTAAKAVPSYDLGVTAMGTTFEVATKSHYVMDIYTVGCNVNDNQANKEWNNEKQDVKASHEEYVNSIINGMKQELIMKMESDKYNQPLYYTLLSTETNFKRTDDNVSIDVFWKKGSYDKESTVKNWCNTMWGIGSKDAYEEALQYTSNKILNTMFVNCNDSVEDNASQQYNPNPYYGSVGDGSAELSSHGAHWYDEESKNKMKVEYYHTQIVFGLLCADDKVDYNLLEQSAYSRLIGQSDNIHVSFYNRLFNESAFTSADGFIWNDHTGTYMIKKVLGTEFSVINQTTAQMKK